MANNKRVLKNTTWNLIGLTTPLLVAVLAIPTLIEQLGTVRFGVLTLAWVMVGYFSLFDFGLGRAITQLMAKKLSLQRHHEIAPLFWTAMVAMLVLGLLGGAACFALTPWLVRDALSIPLELQAETATAFYLLSFCIPVVVVSTGTRGALEAYQYFGLVNLVRTPLGILNFAGPLLVLPFSTDLGAVVGVLLATRLLAGVAFIWLCLTRLRGVSLPVRFRKDMLAPLARFGGWMTVTNVVGPLMTYLDRFIIAGMLTVTAVAYYATPHEMISRLGVIPMALLGALFPAFTAVLASRRAEIGGYYRKSYLYLMLVMFPLALLLVLFAPDILLLWINREFQVNSTGVMQILLFGIYLNSFARIASTLIQSDGRPDITARLHLLEILPYLLALWYAVQQLGVTGAALVWVARVVVDLLLLNGVLAYRGMVGAGPLRNLLLLLAATVLAMWAGVFVDGPAARALYLSCAILFLYVITWTSLLHQEDKVELLGHARRFGHWLGVV